MFLAGLKGVSGPSERKWLTLRQRWSLQTLSEASVITVGWHFGISSGLIISIIREFFPNDLQSSPPGKGGRDARHAWDWAILVELQEQRLGAVLPAERTMWSVMLPQNLIRLLLHPCVIIFGQKCQNEEAILEWLFQVQGYWRLEAHKKPLLAREFQRL